MGKFDRYLLSQLIVVFGFFALVLVIIYWINHAVALFDQLVGDGESISTFLELSVLTLPGIIRIVLPIAAFAASLYVTNRMTAESEMIVVQATGYSAYRLARPVLAFGLMVTLLVSGLTHFLVPASAARLAARQAEIAQDATARLLREGQFMTPTAGVTFYIREITPEGELRDLFLSDSRGGGNTITYTASSAYIVRTERGLQLVMIDGMAQSLRAEDQALGITRFEDFAYNIGALMKVPDLTRRSSREVPTAELLRATPELSEETGRSQGRLVAQGHDRFAQAFLATAGALIGFATLLVGGFSRFGVWRQIIAAVFLIILLKIIESVTTGAVRADPAAWPLIYVPSLVGLLIAWFLLFASGRPHLFRPRFLAKHAGGST